MYHNDLVFFACKDPYIPLGMGSGLIRNNQLSASSIYSNATFYPPWQARLGSDVDAVRGREGSFWRPDDDDTEPWIQVI